MRLGLGTAQFGMAYGISNQEGKIPVDDVRTILATAAANGIDVLDTAPTYGDSQTVIGSALANVDVFRIVTKIPHGSAGKVKDAFRRSLKELKRNSLYGLLVHDARDLEGADFHSLIRNLTRLKEEKLVEKVGVSVYTAAQIDRTLELFVPDIVQVPVSIFDQRLVESGHLSVLRSMGVEIHARSIFLQGILLLDVERAPAFCEPVAEHIKKYFAFLENIGLTRLEAALAFVSQLEDVDVTLVGITSNRDLEQIIEAVNNNRRRSVRLASPADWAIHDEKIVNPSSWPRNTTDARA